MMMMMILKMMIMMAMMVMMISAAYELNINIADLFNFSEDDIYKKAVKIKESTMQPSCAFPPLPIF